jgi:hypothetical protein
VSLTLGLGSTAQAQLAFASNKPYTTSKGSVSAATKEVVGEVIVSGKITNPAGALPGAVVILKDTKQMAVTNADGEFQFVVPANSGPLRAVVTYAGYADEETTLDTTAEGSTVNLANARVIVVARRQQLKKYIKTAHKQMRRELRRLR